MTSCDNSPLSMQLLHVGRLGGDISIDFAYTRCVA
jgi:hypothetical protein